MAKRADICASVSFVSQDIDLIVILGLVVQSVNSAEPYRISVSMRPSYISASLLIVLGIDLRVGAFRGAYGRGKKVLGCKIKLDRVLSGKLAQTYP